MKNVIFALLFEISHNCSFIELEVYFIFCLPGLRDHDRTGILR